VPDGMADRPLRELGGRTPLEAADTPNMDFIAANGICGMAETFFPELPYDSSIANMSILGYDPRKYFTGRAPLEAANLGVKLGEGDIALRCNLVTVEDGRIADFTADHIGMVEARQLMSSISMKVGREGVEFYPGVSYRNVLVVRSSLKPSLKFSAKQPHDIVGEPVAENRIKAESKEAEDTARLLNALMDDAVPMLREHLINRNKVKAGRRPANWIWLWGAGSKPEMPPFRKKFGMGGSIVSAVDLLNGLGKTIGLKVLKVEGATGYLDTNYEGKTDAALDSLEDVNFTYIHLESTDEAGHEGSVEHKIRAIEDIDKRVLGRMLKRLRRNYAIMLMPDHPTPIEVRKHTSEPVPYAIYDTGKPGDSVKSFSEREIREKGSQPLTQAFNLMTKLTGVTAP